MKEKDAQLSRLRDVNRELRKVNKIGKTTMETNDDVEEVKTQLVERERQLDVRIIKSIKFSILKLYHIKELDKRFQLSERSFRRQIMSEIKKKQSLKKQLQNANEKIYEFEITLKV